MLVPFLELGIWAEVLLSIVRLKAGHYTHLGVLQVNIDRLAIVVDANGMFVDVLFFLSGREVGEVLPPTSS
jgi:hypothetical protein